MGTVPRDRSVLSPAAFLLRGLAVGLAAGLIAFVVAFALGEPYVDDAIALEEAAAAQPPAEHPEHAEEAQEPAGQDGMVEISRENQKSWGLLTGTLAIGAALGGLAALAAAAVLGRLGLSARGSTALVALVGFVAVTLVPFTKYPATPPAVGSGETIGGRTASYFALLLVSVLAAIAVVVLANRLRARYDGWTAAFVGAGVYLVVVTGTGLLLPTVNELGDFPADTLWYFRRSSLVTLAALWASIGVGLTVLVGRMHDRAAADLARRELAASL
ncbi:CbtA family protein [Nocardioides daeguensis]|uniref:CbtA family protein n=1 Tax=Nocardioides daeguensis TaxID=908359 RepID=A0ABP6VQ23_9ACTN|nr:CbtA family protein [Nocardioides daeguensis]MBV6727499.1 CbtA family protein [Nocardioides daeguensis]MCR1773279.1 CbtA family protein [Nocardioides daeguensis]